MPWNIHEDGRMASSRLLPAHVVVPLVLAFSALSGGSAAPRGNATGEGQRRDAEASPWEQQWTRYQCRTAEGESSSKCALRLRTTLREELSRPVLAHATDASCPDFTEDACRDELDACAPRAAAVLFAFLDEVVANHRFTDAETEAFVPALLLAARSPSGQLRRTALRVLVALERPEALPLLKAKLRSDDLACQRDAVEWLELHFKRSGRALAAELVPLLGWEDWSDRIEVARLLARYADRRTAAALIGLLDPPPFQIQLAAAEGLGRMGGPVAESAVPKLRRLAQTHWATEVRRAAATAATNLSGKEVAPREPKCVPTLKKSGENWVGTVLGEPVELVPLTRGPVERQESCAGLDKKPDLSFAISENGVCILGTDRGEFGGSIEVVRGGASETVRVGSSVNPIRAVRTGDRMWIIEGGAHLTLAWGALMRVRKAPQGRWIIELVDQLPGTPLAFGSDSQGDLLVLANDSASPGGCDGKQGMYLLRARPDGTLESLP